MAGASTRVIRPSLVLWCLGLCFESEHVNSFLTLRAMRILRPLPCCYSTCLLNVACFGCDFVDQLAVSCITDVAMGLLFFAGAIRARPKGCSDLHQAQIYQPLPAVPSSR